MLAFRSGVTMQKQSLLRYYKTKGNHKVVTIKVFLTFTNQYYYLSENKWSECFINM